VQGSEFDEAEFFRAIAASGTRALLIGRRALVALGIPVLISVSSKPCGGRAREESGAP
jgi:hypothetical protein